MIARVGAFQDRILNGRDWLIPAFLVFLGVVPILVALAIGAWDSWYFLVDGNCPCGRFIGYRHRYNWNLLPLYLPIALLALRQGMKQVANWRDDGLPLLQQFDEGKPREFVRDRIRAISTDHRVFLTAILVDVLIHIVIMWRVVKRFFGDPAEQPLPAFLDWSSYFLIEPHRLVPLSAEPPDVTRPENALLVATTALCVFAIVLLGLLLVGILFRVNLLYLNLIYRRSGASASRDISTALVLDFKDPESCFGLRKLNAILNVQVLAAFIAGLFILIGRYAAVKVGPQDVTSVVKAALMRNSEQLSDAWQQLTPAVLFPTTDQILLAVGWILGTAVVGMPALVKFLPLLTPGARNSRKDYLLQFIPPGSVPDEEDLDRETLDTWASGFASNSFWPTGDSRAFAWFMFVFAMLLMVLFPVQLRPIHADTLLPYAAVVVAASSSMAGAFFWLLRRALWVVDSSLVKPM